MKDFLRFTCSYAMAILLVAGSPAAGQIRSVLISHRVSNFSTTQPATVKAECTLPTTNPYQEVVDVAIYPEPAAERKDDQEQRVVTVELKDIPPGGSKAALVLAWVRSKPVQVPLTAGRKPVEELPAEQKEAFLSDGPLLVLDRVRPIATQAAGDAASDVDKARRLYEHMLAQCRYDVDPTRPPADLVLGGKPASCSELAYTFVALCRAAGIPARTVRAFSNREGNAAWIDWQTHRWAEFFTPQTGWVPVDPTYGLSHSKEVFFARQRPQYCALVDDAFEPRARLLPWFMNFIVRSDGPPLPLMMRPSAAWSPSANRAAERRFFEVSAAALYDSDKARRLAAVKAWPTSRNPLASGFLLEALFDAEPEVRVAAAAGLRRLNDISAIQPMMEWLGIEKDPDVRAALLDAVRGFLDSAQGERQGQVVSELAKTRSDESLALIADLWDSDNRAVRKAVAEGIHKFGDKPEVHKAYQNLARDSDDYIRAVSILRWARVGSHEAVQRLVGLLESRNAWDRGRALEELQRRTGDDFGFQPKERSTSSVNQEAVARFRNWLRENPEAK